MHQVEFVDISCTEIAYFTFNFWVLFFFHSVSPLSLSVFLNATTGIFCWQGSLQIRMLSTDGNMGCDWKLISASMRVVFFFFVRPVIGSGVAIFTTLLKCHVRYLKCDKGPNKPSLMRSTTISQPVMFHRPIWWPAFHNNKWKEHERDIISWRSLYENRSRETSDQTLLSFNSTSVQL